MRLAEGFMGIRFCGPNGARHSLFTNRSDRNHEVDEKDDRRQGCGLREAGTYRDREADAGQIQGPEFGYWSTAAGARMSDVAPLAGQLATMRELWVRAVKDGQIVDLECDKQACALAKDTAPFVHPRLASVDHSGDMTVRHEDWLDSLPAPDPGGATVSDAPADEKPR